MSTVRSVLRFGFGGLCVLGAGRLPAHELTRAAYEARLNAQEQRSLSARLRLATPADASRDGPPCRVTLRLVDAETFRPLPGLVRITGSRGQILAPAGLVNRGIRLRDNHPAKAWSAVVDETAMLLPREKITIEAIAGLETERASVSLDLTEAESRQVMVMLRSFHSPRREGWYAANTHLHLNNLTRSQADEYLRTLPRADGLDLLFVSYLERVRADATYITNEYTRSELEAFDATGVRFGHGEEHRHNFERNSEGYGHVMLLNIRELVRPVSIGPMITGKGPDWPPLRPGIDAARRQRATVVWCHNALGHEDVPDWLAGIVDAQNIFDGGSHGTYEDTFYRYLDVGLKVPFSTGTDWFLYDFSRVYARLAGAPTVPDWLAALKAGRTFITNGPLLELRVGSGELGDTIALAAPAKLPVVARAKGRHDFQFLELVQDGRVVHRVATRRMDDHFEAAFELPVSVEEAGWIALRTPGGSAGASGPVAVPPTLPVRAGGAARNEMGEPLFAHTSPIYVTMQGRGPFKRAAATALVADMKNALERIQARAVFDDAAQREDVLEIYRDGIAQLERQLREQP